MAVKKIDEIIATFMYIGKVPSMPGTAASVAAFVIDRLVNIPLWVILSTILIGGYAADSYSKRKNIEDPSEVVIDEVAGMWISAYGLPAGMGLAALFFFRILDILKPFPVRNLEKLPGGTGIMADDIAAGVMVNVILLGTNWLYFQGGFAALFS